MDSQADRADGHTFASPTTWRPDAGAGAPVALAAPVHAPSRDVAVNAETRTYWDGDELVSILSVHTLVCPLIRAELRAESRVRVLIYYHASTRLGLQAYEAVLHESAAVQERLGLRHFVEHALKLEDTTAQLHDPAVREMYLHEIIRHLSRPIADRRLESSAEFAVARII